MTALKDTLAHLSELHCSKDGKLESALNIRWKSENGVHNRTVDSLDRSIQLLEGLDSKEDTQAIWVNLNSLPKGHLGNVASSAVIARRFILIDIDPKRPGGSNSTEGEKASALVSTHEIHRYLSRSGGITHRLMTDSGNGFHTYIALSPEYPLDRYGDALVKEFLSALSKRFPHAGVDVAVHDRARVVKVAGTMARKGPHSEERPWRRSRIVEHNPSSPDATLTQIEEMVLQLGGRLPQDGTASGDPLRDKKDFPAKYPETSENKSLLAEMLKHINPDVDRHEWRSTIWGICSLGWESGKEIARDWSLECASRFDEHDFDRLWRDYDPSKGITHRSMVHQALKGGYEGQEFQAEVASKHAHEGGQDSLKDFNANYAFVRVNGKSRVLDKKDQSLMTVQDFKSYAANLPPIMVNGRSISSATAWLQSKNRLTYTNLTFKPGQKQGPSGTPYNLWTGWGVEASPQGCCELFYTVLFDVICNGDETSYDYEIGKLAHMIQFPLEKPGVATVIQGLKGTGKSGILRYIERIVGREHSSHATRTSDLTGNFNAGLSTALLLIAEEASWAGDKSAEGPLKNLITEPFIRTERKGIDATVEESYLRLYLTSNERWAVPATSDERRFHVLAANDMFKGDKKFWRAFHLEMSGLGPARLLYELLRYKIPGDFNVHQPPHTKALTEQIQETLTPTQRWWQEVLQTGGIRIPSRYDESGESVSIFHANETDRYQPSKQEYADAFNLYQKQLRFGENGDITSISRFLKKLHGEHIRDVRPGSGTERTRTWAFADLKVLRDDFDKKVVPTEWQAIEPHQNAMPNELVKHQIRLKDEFPF